MSNQEAVWFQNDPEVEKLLRQSDFYVIGGRPEIKFSDFTTDPDAMSMTFDVGIEDKLTDKVTFHLAELPGVADASPESLWIETGEKFVRIWDRPKNEPGADVLQWFTTEKLLMDRAHEMPGLEGLDKHAEFSVYDLLYVGIAKTSDSFDRLIRHGHEARMNILANEPQRFPGARVSDETYLFLFRVNSLVIQTFDSDHEFEDDDFEDKLDRKAVVADAEKAFVSLLKPGYNKTLYSQYPKGADGLYGGGYARYGYLIDETVTYNTADGKIRGVHNPAGVPSNGSDFIFVDGDDVRFFVSGVDFPATPWRVAPEGGQG